jgi:hypothetical protein
VTAHLPVPLDPPYAEPRDRERDHRVDEGIEHVVLVHPRKQHEGGGGGHRCRAAPNGQCQSGVVFGWAKQARLTVTRLGRAAHVARYGSSAEAETLLAAQ